MELGQDAKENQEQSKQLAYSQINQYFDDMEERRELGSHASNKLGIEAYALVSLDRRYVRIYKKRI